MRWRKYDCRKCKDTGVIMMKERVPTSELSPMDLADIMVNGGYCYRLVESRCSCRWCPKT